MSDKAAEPGSSEPEPTAAETGAAEAASPGEPKPAAEPGAEPAAEPAAVKSEAGQPGPPEAESRPAGAGSPGRTTVKQTGPESRSDDPGAGSSLVRVLSVGLGVALVLLIAAVGVGAYLFVQERNQAETLTAHEEVRQAACRYAPVLANYDAKNLDPYFTAVLSGATGDWKKEFETTTAELREALVAGQVVSTAGDIQCAVKSADAESAEAVVVIGQTITSLGTRGQPAPGQLAMVLRMEKTDGRWLVNQMNSPLAPTSVP
ncbi:hypothetical protein [Nocardia sp. NPDC024068]|uniref:hypothetical protein n=1 Tax=Nocardia sp. NPDC024068 TaxID=3157197 RepID=UPI0033DF1A74